MIICLLRLVIDNKIMLPKPIIVFCLLMLLTIIAPYSSINAEEVDTTTAITTKRDQEIITAIEQYLNSISTLVADFVQEAPDQQISEGVFFLKRPGNFRWEYKHPTPIIIVGRDELVTYLDVELEEISYVTLENSLANFLGREEIAIPSEDITLLSISHNDSEALISLYQSAKAEEGVLTLNFSLKPKLQLIGMQLLDPNAQTTHVFFTNHQYGKKLDRKLFFVKKPKRERQ